MPTIITMPDWIYQHTGSHTAAVPFDEKTTTYVFSHMATTTEGGLYAFYQDCPYPEKFCCTPPVMGGLNIVKSLTITLLSMIPYRKPSIVLWNYIKMVDRVMHPFYLRPDLSCIASRQIRQGCYLFLRSLGFDPEIASRMGRIIGTLFEYDVAYRYRLQDIATETYAGALLTNPYREIKRLLAIYRKREQLVDNVREGAADKVVWIFRLMSWALLVPPIRKAFRKAVRNIDFDQLQFDVADRYHCMLRDDYNFFGLTFEQRLKNYKLLHPNGSPPQITI